MTRTDALLFLMALIWGTNYSVVKYAFAEIDPQAFNAIRMVIASAVFLGIIFGVRPRVQGQRRASSPSVPPAPGAADIFHTPASVTRRDWLVLAGLGVVGHFFYQYCFISGVAQTSVANSSLMLAATPVVIALLSAALGQERISRLHWLGAALSMLGIYIVIGQGISLGSGTLRGDLLMFLAVCCWAIYTLGAGPLMRRHSPVGVTGLSMAIGTLIYVPLTLPQLRMVNWSAVSPLTWIALVYSALFAICVAYTIWYMAVREIGSARTSIYSNLVPVVAMMSGIVFLDEPLSAGKLAGAAAVLLGVALTRVGRTKAALPAEE
ncbi:MAG: EamA family transporter [Acidobacteria bacterium]|nr:EamA family transporter [Acidobacteriota bacterium]